MKTSLTIRLDVRLLEELRALSAEERLSLSQFLSSKLEQWVQEQRTYADATRRAVERLHAGTNLGWMGPSPRDELYKR